jgi:alkylhydroperoxidase/carboxymuconolactone decarboxylase family protein YurZ
VKDSTRALVAVATAIGSDDRDGLPAALRAAACAATAVEIEEAMLQSYLFVGYPRVLQAFKAWRAISPSPSGAAPAADQEAWASRGAVVFETVYGAQHTRLMDNVTALHPDLAQWMLIEGYGKVIGRAGLDLVTRELCIVALLATQDAPAQLYSHLRGALHVGATAEDVEETLAIALKREPASRAARARESWETVKSRRGG